MYEARQDIVSGQWVVYSSERAKRPHDFIKKYEYIEQNIVCPFCFGNEYMTPKETYRHASHTIEGWNVRIVENKYPAVSLNETYKMEKGFYTSMQGYGVHEVVVDTPHHHEMFSDFSPNHMQELLCAIKERTFQIGQMENIQYVQIFKNYGEKAGASLTHSHWQLLGTPFIPQRQIAVYDANRYYMEKNNRCLFCEMIKEEESQNVRLVFENDLFLSFTPYASRYSYETWIMSKRHVPSFHLFTPEDLFLLSDSLLYCINRLTKLFPDISYNICFSERPKSLPDQYFHWYLQIIPRRGHLAGFEIGTHSYINPVLPEEAASKLKG